MEAARQHGTERLAQHIRQKGTQVEFCREIGCSEAHLSLVLKGERRMSLELAKAASELTGIPLSDLPVSQEVAEALRTEPAA